jgi:hypothetical protein
MGVVNTTYTFLGTDTITSSKLNNIIDDTTFTSDAIQGTTLQVVSPGKLAVSAGGITSNEMAANSVVTTAITDSNVTTAKIADANVTQAKLAANVVGNGPAFRAYPGSSQSIPNATDTKVILANEDYDTNSNFAVSRFTPSIAGYYLIKGSVGYAASRTSIAAYIYKNGSFYSSGVRISGATIATSVVDIVYLNGSSDYVELYTRHLEGTSVGTDSSSNATNFSGCLIRSA